MYLCIDIGTNSIKAVEKDPRGIPVKWGILERENNPFHTSIYNLSEADTIYCLAALLDKMKIDSNDVIASVPSFLTFTAIADTPDFSVIPADSGTFKPFSIPLPNGKYFLAAIPNEVVEKYETIFRASGLNLLKLEPESVALAKNLGSAPGRSLIVDVGGRSTNFVLAQKGFPYFVEHTDFAMASKNPDVILNKVKEIAVRQNIKKIIPANAFSVAEGL